MNRECPVCNKTTNVALIKLVYVWEPHPERNELNETTYHQECYIRHAPAVKALIEWVKGHQWVSDSEGNFCPDCGAEFHREDHREDCGLIAVLAPFEEASDG